jgi:hypothetical protein
MTNRRFSFLMAEAKARESPHPVKPVQITAWSFDCGTVGEKMSVLAIR